MNDLELEAAIRYLQPNAEFSFTEADFDSIVWDKVEGNPPTLAEIQQALKDIKAQEAARAKAKADAAAARLERSQELDDQES